MPTGFSWKTLAEKKIKDAVVFELKTDVKLSPKVKIRENVNFPRCCLSAFLLQQGGNLGEKITKERFELLQTLFAPVFLGRDR